MCGLRGDPPPRRFRHVFSVLHGTSGFFFEFFSGLMAISTFTCLLDKTTLSHSSSARGSARQLKEVMRSCERVHVRVHIPDPFFLFHYFHSHYGLIKFLPSIMDELLKKKIGRFLKFKENDSERFSSYSHFNKKQE